MSIYKKIKSFFPKGLLWRLTFVNILVIISAIGFSGWALYQTACFLIRDIGNLDAQRQFQFNTILLQYLWIFSIIGIIVGSLLHFHFIKKILNPVRKLIESTKQMKSGQFPDPIEVHSKDEVGELVEQFNGLVQQLRHNETYREKVVSDLSHEFRTPLSNLNGYLHALQTGVIAGDEQLYESLYKESNRLTLMVEQLEQLNQWDDLSSLTLLEKKNVNIASQIEQCASMFNWTLTEANISIKIEVEPQDILIQVEGIQQVINNLLDNAIQYYDGTGPITLKGESLNGFYQISVCGPSQPISEEEKKYIFERFYRIDTSRSRETGGSGLGLAIAKEIIEHHKGNLNLKIKDKRNCFYFTLPYK